MDKSSPLKILQLCNKPPFPLVDGGCVAMHAVSHGLNLYKQQVKVVSAHSYKHPLSAVPETYRKRMDYEAVYIDLHPHLWKAFLNLFTSESYVLKRFLSAGMLRKLKEIFRKQDFDIVQIESIFMAPYIPLIRKYSKARIYVRTHNVESDIWEKLAKTKGPLKRWYFDLLSKRLRKEEIFWLNKADAIFPITQKDMEVFRDRGVKVPMKHLPFGVIDTLMPNEVSVEFPSLFYLGAMNWLPNEEGMRWFLDEVWTEVHEKCPDLRMYVAGRKMPAWISSQKYPNVVVLGEVEDAKTFMLGKAIMVVPILSGSGVRIKIIEGMLAGKMVITTSLGAQGIDCENNKNIRIADGVDEFVEAIVEAVSNQEEVERIGENARNLILENHANDKIMEDLLEFYREDLKSGK